jgi:hypothetical protein
LITAQLSASAYTVIERRFNTLKVDLFKVERLCTVARDGHEDRRSCR